MLLSQLAELRSEQLGDLDGAISALRQALAAVPGEIAVMHQLATCLLARAGNAEPQAARIDHRRAAELFYQIAQGVDDAQAVAYLESALVSMPDHDGALVLLERIAPEQNQTAVLPRYWVGYVAAAAQGPEVDKRRLLLGQAYFESGQLEDAIYCLQPAAEHGNERAHELLQRVYARQASEAGARESSVPDELGVPAQQSDAADAMWPTTRPPARQIDDERARAAARIAELRKQVHEALASRRNDEAAELCRAILELDPNDTEAFNLLESHCRKRRDYAGLRDLLLASTRVPGLSVEARKLRLREVATLSESKLRDSDGAVSAWRSVATLDPADREATQQPEAAAEEGAALGRTRGRARARGARDHRGRREGGADPRDRAAASRQAQGPDRDRGGVPPAVRAQAGRRRGTRGAVRPADPARALDRRGAAVARAHRGAPRTTSTNSSGTRRWRRFCTRSSPTSKALIRRARRSWRCGRATRPRSIAWNASTRKAANYARLLSTLERRALLVPKAERPALFMRMGAIAEEQLRDLDKAADYFGDALDLAPENTEALQRMVEMFERAARYEQLVELLRERCLLEKDPSSRALLHRRIAQTLATYLGDAQGAAEAYRKLLEIEEDEEALRFLRDAAARDDNAEELATACCRALAALRRATRASAATCGSISRSCCTSSSTRPAEAAHALTRLLNEVDARFEPAIELLAKVSEASGNRAGAGARAGAAHSAARATRRRACRSPSSSPTCRERELHDPARAIAALQLWSRDDAQNPEPQRRLRPLLTEAEAWPALLTTLDALSEWEDEFGTRDEAAIAAARVAFERCPTPGRVAQAAAAGRGAQRTGRSVAARGRARRAGCCASCRRCTSSSRSRARIRRSRPCTGAARPTCSSTTCRIRRRRSRRRCACWRPISATASSSAHADRLALQTKSFRRMSQVYDRLLKQATGRRREGRAAQAPRRPARADQQDEALDRILRACALAPHDEALLERAEALAQRTRRSEELLMVYDRRRSRSDRRRRQAAPAAACGATVRRGVARRERANQYLKGALAVAGARRRSAPKSKRSRASSIGAPRARRRSGAARR